MSGCHVVDMPVCEHLVPIKFECDRCNPRKIQGMPGKLTINLDNTLLTLNDEYISVKRMYQNFIDLNNKVKELEEKLKQKDRQPMYISSFEMEERISKLENFEREYYDQFERTDLRLLEIDKRLKNLITENIVNKVSAAESYRALNHHDKDIRNKINEIIDFDNSIKKSFPMGIEKPM